ncbi:odorant receptor 13a-like [Camponotus floridanus]|nr:odorant receptor 13a-like [Camponotus floridanus]
MESSGYRDFLWAIDLNRRSLELIGLWPNMDGVVKRRFGPDIRASFAFIMIVFILGIPLVHAFMRVWGDMILMIDNLRLTLPIFSILLKFVIMRQKQSVLLSVINMMKEDWMTLTQVAERDVMMKRVRISRLIIICSYVLMVFTLIMITIFPYFGLSFRHLTNLTDRNKPLILQTYYCYDTDKSPQFELTYFTQVVGLFMAVVMYASIDSFLGLVIFHVCGQLENFRGRLVNLDADNEFKKALSYNVETHVRLIRYVDIVEDIFNLMMLTSMVHFSFLFCVFGFVLIVMINNEKINAASFSRIYYIIVIIIILFAQMFFYCYGAELITEQSEAVYHSVYDLEWYNWESKQARNLILLMIRIQKPFRITAGKIVPLTMTTFCNLLKTSASYMSVLLAIQN